MKEDLSKVPKRSVHTRKQSILSTKQSKTTNNNSWIGKDESATKKCFEQNTVPWNAQKNRTTKNWVEEDLNKFPEKRRP